MGPQPIDKAGANTWIRGCNTGCKTVSSTGITAFYLRDKNGNARFAIHAAQAENRYLCGFRIAVDMRKFLIAGLGNTGITYENTRHNIGFQVVDEIAREAGAEWCSERLAIRAAVSHKGAKLVLIKPTTYVNQSGKAVRHWLKKEKVPVENLLVITDDIHLEFGAFRLRGKGSDGGHNGLKSVENCLQTSGYARFRFGVGCDFSPGQQVDYVLGEWTPEEQCRLIERLPLAAKLVASFTRAGLSDTMGEFNGR